MAAVYPHNPVDSRHSRDENSEITEHSRNLSAVSSATLLTNITSHSQPNEPLLPTPKSPGATTTYCDHLPHQTRPPDGCGAHLRWTEPPALCADPNGVSEKSRSSRKWNRKRWKRRKQIKWALEVIIGAWAIYNAVRYFLAFNVYGRETSTGQVICLGLGTSAGVSFALTIFASFVSIMKHKRLYLLRIYPIMRYLSSCLLFAPTVVNLVFVFLWRDSPNPRFNLHFRCHIDMDVFWTVTTNPCSIGTYSWGLWVLSIFLRFAMTLFVLSTYHIITFLYPEPPRRPMHHRLRSGSENLYTPQSTPAGERPSLSMLMSHQDLRTQHHPSDISLDGATLSDDHPPIGRIRPARSRSSGLSAETTHGDTQSLGRKYSSSTENEARPDQNSFADRFRSILSQVSQEADDAVEYARNDQASSPEKLTSSIPAPSGLPPIYSRDDYDDDSDDEQDIHEQLRGRDSNNMFNLPPVPPSLGYNEFGLPYPPDQDVRMLNGYIRRMPTIESMGSGEVGTSIGASSARQGGGSISSRPPTRNTLLSFVSTEYDVAGSNPPSRTNSLSARAELFLSLPNGTSEHGELLGRPESALRRVSTPNSFVESPVGSPVVDTFSSGTAGSRATTMSYYTATTGSSGESFHAPSHLDTTPRPSRTRE